MKHLKLNVKEVPFRRDTNLSSYILFKYLSYVWFFQGYLCYPQAVFMFSVPPFLTPPPIGQFYSQSWKIKNIKLKLKLGTY